MAGKGAARLGDTAMDCADPVDTPTGTVVSAGTVLINKMPAAKQTDQIVGVDIHIVMIPTPGGPVPTPLPHPFTGIIDGELESTVKIMGMPAATVGSTASNTPPHIPQGGPFQKPPMNSSKIMLGSVNVFIGSGSGGGGGGGSASQASDGIFPVSLSSENLSTQQGETGHFLDVGYVDNGGVPISDSKYELLDPEQNISDGHLVGTITRYNIEEGEYEVALRDVVSVKWKCDEETLDNKVNLEVKTLGIKDSTDATITIFERLLGKPDRIVSTIGALSVQGDEVRATWRYPRREQEKIEDSAKRLSAPDYYYVVKIQGIEKRSSILRLSGEIEITVTDEQGAEISDMGYFLYLSGGEIRKGDLKNSPAVEDALPPGTYKLEFANVEGGMGGPSGAAHLPALDSEPGPEGEIPGAAVPGAAVSDSQSSANTAAPGESSAYLPDDGRHSITVLEFEDKLFRTESAVVLPEQEDPSEGSSEDRHLTPVGIVATCLRYAQEHPQDKILVAGHTDTAGDTDYNQKLSRWRAETVVALLTGNATRWSQICTGWDRMKIMDYNQILAWLSDTRGWSCHPGAIDDNDHVHATNRFREAYNAKGPGRTWAPRITEYGASNNAETWEAYFNCYQEYIAKELGVDLAGLRGLQNGLKFYTSNKWVGCNEYHPREAENIDDFPCDSNRRVEVLFIEPDDDLPVLACDGNMDACNGQACKLYLPAECRRVMRAPMLSAKPWKASWENGETPVTMGETRKMSLTAPGLPAGEPIVFTVHQLINDETVKVIATKTVDAGSDSLDVPFEDWFDYNMDADYDRDIEALPKVALYFEVTGGGRTVISQKIPYGDFVEKNVTLDGEPMHDSPFYFLTPWGKISVTSDGNGTVRIDDIPPGGGLLVAADPDLYIRDETD